MEGCVTDVPFVDLRAQARELHDEFSEVFESILLPCVPQLIAVLVHV